MEIKYTNFALDPKVYGKNEITAVLDQTGTYLRDNIYDIRLLAPKTRLPVGMYLRLGTNVKTRKLIFDMLSELEIPESLQKRRLDHLSTSELGRILIIKACASQAKNIILERLDAYLNHKDFEQVLKTLKNHLSFANKNVIITVTRPENLIHFVDRFVVVNEEGRISYNGPDFSRLKVETDIKVFTKLANEHGASLREYKEPADLLKAIYRSVKR